MTHPLCYINRCCSNVTSPWSELGQSYKTGMNGAHEWLLLCELRLAGLYSCCSLSHQEGGLQKMAGHHWGSQCRKKRSEWYEVKYGRHGANSPPHEIILRASFQRPTKGPQRSRLASSMAAVSGRTDLEATFQDRVARTKGSNIRVALLDDLYRVGLVGQIRPWNRPQDWRTP